MRAPATKWAEVDLTAIRDNVRTVAGVVGRGTAVMAVVKANGYGHGAVPAARAALAGGATWLGVSSIQEALELRHAGIDARMLNLGYTPPAAIPLAASEGISVTLYDEPSLRATAAANLDRPLGVHVKVDTGMHRLGAAPEAAAAMAAMVRDAKGLALEGVYTHFADADGTDPAFTEGQLATFLKVRESIAGMALNPVRFHAANSAGLLRFPAARLDLVRAGIVCYGVRPAPNMQVDVPLRPALRWHTIVTNVVTLAAGETVGYGRTFRARQPTPIATIAVGYADGLHRRLSNRGKAIVRGCLVPIVGTISMDQAALDVSDVPAVRIGDQVTLIGAADAARWEAEDMAQAAGTIAYEVLCAISARVERRYRELEPQTPLL